MHVFECQSNENRAFRFLWDYRESMILLLSRLGMRGGGGGGKAPGIFTRGGVRHVLAYSRGWG